MKSVILMLILVSTQAMAAIVLNVRCESEKMPLSHLNMQFQMNQKPSVDYFYKGRLLSQETIVSGVELTRSTFKASVMAEFSPALATVAKLNLDLKKCNNVAIAGKANIVDYSYSLVNVIKPTFQCKCVYASH